MAQYELIEQITNNLDYNFTEESKLILLDEILENIIQNIPSNNKLQVKKFNTLTTIQLLVKEIMK